MHAVASASYRIEKKSEIEMIGSKEARHINNDIVAYFYPVVCLLFFSFLDLLVVCFVAGKHDGKSKMHAVVVCLRLRSGNVI